MADPKPPRPPQRPLIPDVPGVKWVPLDEDDAPRSPSKPPSLPRRAPPVPADVAKTWRPLGAAPSPRTQVVWDKDPDASTPAPYTSNKVAGSRSLSDPLRPPVTPEPKATWSGKPIVPPQQGAPERARVVWEKDLEAPAQGAYKPSDKVAGSRSVSHARSVATDPRAALPERPGAPRLSVQPPQMRQVAPPPVPGRERLANRTDLIRIGMRPGELPGVISYFDQQGARQVLRGQREDWHGAPIIAFPTTVGESLIIGPSLEGDYHNRPEICMDRAAFEYDKNGDIKAFAIADGVSQGLASASVADHLVRIVTKALVEVDEKANRLLSKSEVHRLMTYVQAKLRERIDVAEIERDFRANTTMHPDFAEGIIEEIRRGSSIGSSTLIAGVVRKGLYPGTNEMGEHVTMTQIGDGGYVVIGPYTRRDASVFGKFERAGKAPAQVAPGKKTDVPAEDIVVQQVALRSGEILLAVTDGIEKGAWKSLEAFQARAQELFQQGYTDPNQLVRRLLWESNRGSGSWADDTTIFAHRAR